ncbi:MAG: ASCH domain-containing protein [Planctomycetaceae bacterium]
MGEPPAEIDLTLPALGIRQPWVELILRGIKTVEVRAVPTNVRGTIYLYASRTPGDGEVVERAMEMHDVEVEGLPRGVLVGTAELIDCRLCSAADAAAACVPTGVLRGKYGWVLANPQRLKEPVSPRFLPYGIWFYPFVRRNGAER